MRIRTVLPSATAAILVAAVLAIPVASAQADTTPPSASASTSASATASPSTTDSTTAAPATDPTSTPSDSSSSTPSDTPTTPPVTSTPTSAAAPQVTGVTSVDESWGLALQAQVTSDAGADTVTATINGPAAEGDAPVTVNLSLVSGTATDGTWQTTTPLALSYDHYTVAVNAVDADNTPSAAGQATTLDFVPTPIFHNVTITPTHLSYGHETITATGSATLYDPLTGPTTQPYADNTDCGVYEIDLAWNNGDDGSDIDCRTGDFTVTANPGPVGTDTFTLSTDGWNVRTIAATQVVTTDAARPTRIVLDRPSITGFAADSKYTITGTAQYQNTAGTWVPLTYNQIDLGSQTYPTATGETNSAGRFSIATAFSNAAGSWTVSTQGEPQLDPFLTASQAKVTFTNPVQVSRLSLNGASMNAFSQLSFGATYSSTIGHLYGNRVYVLQSPNGKTGWVNLGYIPTNSSGYLSTITAYVNNPHGYWRLYTPAGPGYYAAYSNIVHTFRYQTLVTGGKPSATTVNRNQTVHFSGGVYQRGFGAWLPFRAPVLVIFRPTGSADWYLMDRVWSNSKGAYSANVKVPESGDWMVEYYYADKWHVDTAGPETYIRVR